MGTLTAKQLRDLFGYLNATLVVNEDTAGLGRVECDCGSGESGGSFRLSKMFGRSYLIEEPLLHFLREGGWQCDCDVAAMGDGIVGLACDALNELDAVATLVESFYYAGPLGFHRNFSRILDVVERIRNDVADWSQVSNWQE